MTTIRDVIKRDLGARIEGVVKVFDRESLVEEMREYILTDKIEDEIKKILDTFTQVSEVLRRRGQARDVMGIWVSGFFGSGKSHFAKVLGHLFQNTVLDSKQGEYCIDVFEKHVSDTPRGKDIRLRLGELKATTNNHCIAFEIKSRQSLTNPNSVGEIILSEFYRDIGLSEHFVVARIERRLQQRGLLEKLASEYEAAYEVPWRSPDGRDDFMTVRRRLAVLLPKVDPSEYPDEKTSKDSLVDMFHHESLTAEGIAEELVAWVDAQDSGDGKVTHLVFVIDEMGTFIGDSIEKISELNSIAEMLANKGKGKVWLICTSQQDLESVVDRTNLQTSLVGRLNARFELKPHLISDEISKVVSERILKKHPSREGELRQIYHENEGYIAQLSDLKASRSLGVICENSFVDAYPYLPHQIRLAQDIFEVLSGFRISGGVRSMISVVMEAIQDVADEELGVVVSLDQIFDAVENDLLAQEFLGVSGIRAIYDADERVPKTPLEPSRILKVLWMLQKLTWVPRVEETIAKLLVRNLATELPELRDKVGITLEALQKAGYIAKDEASGEWKYLNDRERTIEQAIQEMVRTGGARSISLAMIRRTSQQICRDEIITKRKLANFTVAFGKTKTPFPFGVCMDGEVVESGAELEVRFLSPLAPARSREIEDIRGENQASGIRGQIIWWIADTPGELEIRLKRYEALVRVTNDKRFVDDASRDTQDALSEKRKERDELRSAIIRDLEHAFLKGAIYYTGQEMALEGVSDLKEPLSRVFSTIIPNVYPLFNVADRPIDFAKTLKGILNPATTELNTIAPELELFDAQGNLQRESALVSHVLEVLRDLEDEGEETVGALLLDAGDRKGFRGFIRSPYHWSSELVRLVLAGCHRAGAIYIERQSSVGPYPVYDFHDCEEYFNKISLFRAQVFRIAEESLTVGELKRASKTLISMGATGVAETGNALASGIRELGSELKVMLSEAVLRHQQGLPIPNNLLDGEVILTEAMTTRDPTVVVKGFLANEEQWRRLQDDLLDLRSFLDAHRLEGFEASRKLDDLVEKHPIPEAHEKASVLQQAREDMQAIISEKGVISRWNDYRDSYERACNVYREVYLEAYERTRLQANATLLEIKEGQAYNEAPQDQKDEIVDSIFGDGRVCHYPPIELPGIQDLLGAAEKNSLTALTQALVALPGYKATVEAELRKLAAELLRGNRIYEWSAQEIMGRTFSSKEEVDEFLNEIGEKLKEYLRQGYTIIVK